jgi:hypothetical protein
MTLSTPRERMIAAHARQILPGRVPHAERFEYSAIMVQAKPDTFKECSLLIKAICEQSGECFFLMKHGDVTCGISDGDHMQEFCYRLVDENLFQANPHTVHSLDPQSRVHIADFKRRYGKQVPLAGHRQRWSGDKIYAPCPTNRYGVWRLYFLNEKLCLYRYAPGVN